jgi:hypothetical protein
VILPGNGDVWCLRDPETKILHPTYSVLDVVGILGKSHEFDIGFRKKNECRHQAWTEHVGTDL